MEITREQALRLAAAASCDPRTVVAMYEGKDCKGLVRARIAAAATRLKMPPPPPKPPR